MNSTVAGFTRRFLPLLGISVVVLAVGLAGCQKKPPSGGEKGASTPPPTPAPPSASSTPATPAVTPAAAPQEDKVVATVNGVNITESQVQKRIDVRYKPLLAKLAQQSPQMAAQQEKVLRENIAKDLVTEMLLDEQVKLAGIQVTDEDLAAEMTKQLAAQNPPMSIEQYQKIVEAQGGDFAAMKGFLMQSMRYHKLLETKFAGELAVTDAEAKKYYDENPKEFLLPERVRASHILISTRPLDPNTDPNQLKVQAKQKAEELLKKAKEGADFAALAKENSEDPGSKAQGGDLGLFPRGQMVKPFEDAAFGLQVGEISNLVETQFGYHIIKVTERADPTPVPFEEAKGKITEELAQKKRSDAVRTYIESLRQNAKIVFPPGSALAPQASPPKIVAPADPNKK
jgi:peptidyl-prolyl cis-trans isomerase C